VCAGGTPLNIIMKTFQRYISGADDLAEGVSLTVTRAASVAVLLRMKNQLARMSTPDGKALASGLLSLASLVALAQFTDVPPKR
jgi:hypothetical protein